MSNQVAPYQSNLSDTRSSHGVSVLDWFTRSPAEPDNWSHPQQQEVTLNADASLPVTAPTQRSLNGHGAVAREPQLPDFTHEGLVDRIPLSGLQCSAADYLSFSWRTIPHVVHSAIADVTAMEHNRRTYNESLPAAERPLSEAALIIKAVALALETHAHLNASFDARTQELLLKQYVNIALNLETPEGPVMPVIQDAAAKDVLELEDEVEWLIAQARTGELCAEEMTGATFTVAYRGLAPAAIRNSSLIRESGFTPIIPWPQVAALGISRIEQQTNHVGDNPQRRMTMPLSLSYDQRVLSGADALHFLEDFCELLAQPLELTAEP